MDNKDRHKKIIENRIKPFYFYDLLPEEEKKRIRKDNKKYMKKHPEIVKKNNKKWREKNKEKWNKYQREYHKKKFAEDPEYREKMRAYWKLAAKKRKEKLKVKK